jgi:hypothetical protein
MSKNQSFRVEIEFNSKIQSDEETMEIAQNIANAIIFAANDGNGIAPSEGDAYTMIVRVTPQYLNKAIIEHTN